MNKYPGLRGVAAAVSLSALLTGCGTSSGGEAASEVRATQCAQREVITSLGFYDFALSGKNQGRPLSQRAMASAVDLAIRSYEGYRDPHITIVTYVPERTDTSKGSPSDTAAHDALAAIALGLNIDPTDPTITTHTGTSLAGRLHQLMQMPSLNDGNGMEVFYTDGLACTDPRTGQLAIS